jgi:hypothetical protein
VLGGSSGMLTWSRDMGSMCGVVLNECAGCTASLCRRWQGVVRHAFRGWKKQKMEETERR